MANKAPTANFSVKAIQDKQTVINHIEKREGRFTVTITDGIKRSNEQNRLQRLWINELTEQSKENGISSEEWRAYIKLQIGVPILRQENEAFRVQYDKTIEHLTYEQKMSIMAEPISFPVTSLMTVKQKTKFLEMVHLRMSQQGFILTDPTWQGWDNIQ